MKKLIIVGTGPFAEIAKLYFETYSKYKVSAFSVEANFVDRSAFCNLPVVEFEKIENVYDPSDFEIFVAITYINLNHTRARLLSECKRKGFGLASFISPYSFRGPQTEINEHCFIFENNIIQPFVKIDSNVILWSGNHIGHHSYIRDNCFISSHVVISGFCEIGMNTFIGVNASVSNNVKIGSNCIIGPGTLVKKNIADDSVIQIKQSDLINVSATRLMKVNNP